MKKMQLLTAMLLVWSIPDAKAWWWFDKYPSKYEASKARDKWIEDGGEVLQRKEGHRMMPPQQPLNPFDANTYPDMKWQKYTEKVKVRFCSNDSGDTNQYICFQRNLIKNQPYEERDKSNEDKVVKRFRW